MGWDSGWAGNRIITGNLDVSGTANFQDAVKIAVFKKLFFDGGTDTFIQEIVDNELAVFVNDIQVITVRASDLLVSKNLTVTGDKILHPFEDAITASTTQTQAGGYALTKDMNTVNTVANTNDAVTMPVAEAGRLIIITNQGANVVQVFPALGDNFANLAVNLPLTIASASDVWFFATNNTEWGVK